MGGHGVGVVNGVFSPQEGFEAAGQLKPLSVTFECVCVCVSCGLDK